MGVVMSYNLAMLAVKPWHDASQYGYNYDEDPIGGK